MPLVTLIGEKLAKVNLEFVYIGPQNDCRNCKLKTVCFNLKQGRHYKITKLRDKRHSCNVHDGLVAIVEVQELPIITCIDKKLSKGDTSKIEIKNCNNIGCEHYELCITSLQKDKEYKIIKTFEDINCPIGYTLQKAELTD